MIAREKGWDSIKIRQKVTDPQFIIQQTYMDCVAEVILGGKNVKWHRMSQVANSLMCGKDLNKAAMTASLFGKYQDRVILELGGILGVQKKKRGDVRKYFQDLCLNWILKVKYDVQRWSGEERAGGFWVEALHAKAQKYKILVCHGNMTREKGRLGYGGK